MLSHSEAFASTFCLSVSPRPSLHRAQCGSLGGSMVMVSGRGRRFASGWDLGTYCKWRGSPVAGRYRPACLDRKQWGWRLGAHLMFPLGTSGTLHPAHSPAINPVLAAGSGSQALRRGPRAVCFAGLAVQLLPAGGAEPPAPPPPASAAAAAPPLPVGGAASQTRPAHSAAGSPPSSAGHKRDS